LSPSPATEAGDEELAAVSADGVPRSVTERGWNDPDTWGGIWGSTGVPTTNEPAAAADETARADDDTGTARDEETLVSVGILRGEAMILVGCKDESEKAKLR
jgi:hypothetical protein